MSAVEKVSSALAFTLDEFQHVVLKKGRLRLACIRLRGGHVFSLTLINQVPLTGWVHITLV